MFVDFLLPPRAALFQPRIDEEESLQALPGMFPVCRLGVHLQELSEKFALSLIVQTYPFWTIFNRKHSHSPDSQV